MFAINKLSRQLAALAIAGGLVATASAAPRSKDADERSGVRTVTVTVVKDDGSGAQPALDASEFAVYRGDRKQQIVGVKGPSEAPVNVAVLIQDGLVSGVANEIKTIRTFINGLPEGSKVAVGYLRNTGLQLRQPLTADRRAATKALRIPLGSIDAGSAPFLGLEEAIRLFDGVEGRNQIILISNGLELNRDLSSASPTNNIDLDRAIAAAQRRGIPVWSLFANAPGAFGRGSVVVLYGQGSLQKLSDETGGEAFFTGTGFVSFDRALEAIADELGDQYVITYTGEGKGKLEVTTETANVKLRHAE